MHREHINISPVLTRLVTERARKLRAQYALQAQGLRTRLEMRVNRIPQALRKRNMQDLVDEHAAKAKPAPAPPMPVVSKVHQQVKAAAKAPASSTQSSKRKRYVGHFQAIMSWVPR